MATTVTASPISCERFESLPRVAMKFKSAFSRPWCEVPTTSVSSWRLRSSRATARRRSSWETKPSIELPKLPWQLA
jgi:hypothetical protein